MNDHDHYQKLTALQRKQQCPLSGWRRRLYIIIFESDTPWGKAFDVALLVAILASVAVISLETVGSIASRIGYQLGVLEWTFTVLFTVEYFLRIACVRKPLRYIFSFWGAVDLLSILPSYVSLFGGANLNSFSMTRSLRLLRVFRVMKLLRLMTEADDLYRSIWESRGKIVVFLFTVLIAVTLSGTLMYVVENIDDHMNHRTASSSFNSIPQSMYWAIVTMTTVGYGDVVPTTTAGKAISAVLILLGYSLITVPTGFVTAKLVHNRSETDQECHRCGRARHLNDARYCNQCGERLIDESTR